MSRQKINHFDTEQKYVRVCQVDLKRNKSHQFLYIPILFSFLALYLIMSPAMANEAQLKFGGCPYVQQYHQVMMLDHFKTKRKNYLIRVSAGHAPLDIQKPEVRTITF